MADLILSINDNKEQLFWGSLDNPENNELLFEIDIDKIPELMAKEKERLGIPKEQLVFMGTKNTADYYWCAWQYYQKAKREELKFFEIYLTDRIKYAKKFGLVEKYPKTNILEIGDKIDGSDIQKQILKIQKNCINFKDKNPESNIPIADISRETALRKGEIYERIKAEQYPSLQWHYRYKNLILIGLPDGITDEFVYEFKSVKAEKYIKDALMRASYQANIYGICFERSKLRIQIYCEETDKIYTYENAIDKQKVFDLLEKWIDMINRKLPIKPLAYKCNICEFKNNCVILKK